jgi:hypothetical protein
MAPPLELTFSIPRVASVKGITISGTGTKLAAICAVSNRQMLYVWNIQTGAALVIRLPRLFVPQALEFSGQESRVVVVTPDDMFTIVIEGSTLRSLSLPHIDHPNQVAVARFSRDGERLAYTTSSQPPLTVFKTLSAQGTESLVFQQRRLVALSPSGQHIVISDTSGSSYWLVGVDGGHQVPLTPREPIALWSLKPPVCSMSDAGDVIALHNSSVLLGIWRIEGEPSRERSRDVIAHVPLSFKGITALAVSPCGNSVTFVANGETVVTIDTTSRALRQLSPPLREFRYRTIAMCSTLGGDIVAIHKASQRSLLSIVRLRNLQDAHHGWVGAPTSQIEYWDVFDEDACGRLWSSWFSAEATKRRDSTANEISSILAKTVPNIYRMSLLGIPFMSERATSPVHPVPCTQSVSEPQSTSSGRFPVRKRM